MDGMGKEHAQMKKIGIMGGTFNPIHFGHLFLAEDSYEQMGLDQILFMPSKNPPHKSRANLVSDWHRENMVKLAIEDNPHFAFSGLELMREGLTYTADTLSILTQENPDTHYYFIIGADSLFMLPTWKKPEVICSLCTLVSSDRDQVGRDQLEKQAAYIRGIYGARVILLSMPTIQISSEQIRKRLRSGQSLRYYLPEKVLNYIGEHELYGVIGEQK